MSCSKVFSWSQSRAAPDTACEPRYPAQAAQAAAHATELGVSPSCSEHMKARTW